jgi:hypothetical protein
MRTTILLSSLLFLAGYASAQDDSPITVGDSIPTRPAGSGNQRAPKKVPIRGPSTFVGHSEFKFDGPNKIHHITDTDHH